MKSAWKNLLDLREERQRMIDSFPTVMVMQDSASARETHLLVRGAYDRPGEKVEPGVPGVLPPLPAGAPNNRLGLAQWLVDRGNPLTARVAVNRFWQNYFGAGLVKTVEDFGSQGEWPSNPELLDWLATEFMDHGWDMKALQKTIVSSATYRQSSVATPDLLQKDPENRMLARGPRVRLSAEMVRDQALARVRFVGRKGGWTFRQALSAGRPLERAIGRRRLQTGSWRCFAPAQPLHVLEAHGAAADDDELRCGRAGDLRGAGFAHEYAFAVVEPDERCDVPGGRSQNGGAHDAGRREHAGRADRVWV